MVFAYDDMYKFVALAAEARSERADLFENAGVVLPRLVECRHLGITGSWRALAPWVIQRTRPALRRCGFAEIFSQFFQKFLPREGGSFVVTAVREEFDAVTAASRAFCPTIRRDNGEPAPARAKAETGTRRSLDA